MNLWSVPRDWAGETCVILAGGPSMTREIAAKVRASGCRSIAVNSQGIEMTAADGSFTTAMAPWADVLYAADRLWWRNNQDKALAFQGLKVTICTSRGEAALHSPLVKILGNGGPRGFDERKTHLRTGHNGGYQAVHLAVHFGATRILLCGFDMHARRGEHWHADHHFRPNNRAPYELFINGFRRIAPYYASAGVDVINCTPGSALDCFPFADLEGALDGMQHMRESQTRAAGLGAAETRGGGAQDARV